MHLIRPPQPFVQGDMKVGERGKNRSLFWLVNAGIPNDGLIKDDSKNIADLNIDAQG